MATFSSQTPGGVFTFDPNEAVPTTGTGGGGTVIINSDVSDIDIVELSDDGVTATYQIVLIDSDGNRTPAHTFTVDHGAHVTAVDIDGAGVVVLTLSDGSTITATGTATGPEGPAGPQGIQGPAGMDGARGLQGPQGQVGPVGPAGAQGAQGNAGTPGTDGTDGAQGPAGPQGNQGLYEVFLYMNALTLPGTPSDTVYPLLPTGWSESPTTPTTPEITYITVGVYDPANPSLLVDWSAPFAATGTVGATGPRGPAGATGSDGAQGPVGPTGPTGPAGAQGIQGPVGPAGADGNDGAAGAMGATGDQGATGADGAQGPAGAQGAKGDTGNQGPTGAKGDTGDAGAAGAQGIQGMQGEKGDDGDQGPAGTPGSQGPAGTPGAAGAQGIQGIQGIQGNTGATGPAGADGNDGTSAAEITDVSVAATGVAQLDGSAEYAVTVTLDDGTVIDADTFIAPRGPAGMDGTGGGGTANTIDTLGAVENSDNVPRSGGVFVQLAGKQDTITALSDVPVVAAAFNAKQDLNIIVDDEAARLALLPNDYAVGELILQEDTGEIFIVTGPSGAQILHRTDNLDMYLSQIQGTSGEGTIDHDNRVDVYSAARVDTLVDGVADTVTTLTGRVTTNEGTIQTIIRDYVEESRIDLATEAGNSDSIETATIYSRLRIDELVQDLETAPSITLLTVDPPIPSQGETWYNTTDNVIRYFDGTAVVEVAAAGAGSITGITGPVADGTGLRYTATRSDGTTISWTTQTSGGGVTPITPTFTAAVNPHTFVNTPTTATTEEAVLTLNATGSGVTYVGYTIDNTADTETIISSAPAASGTGTSIDFEINTQSGPGTVTFTGMIEYRTIDDPNTSLFHPYSATLRVVAAMTNLNHVFYAYEGDSVTDADTAANLASYTDTGVAAVEGARFTVPGNSSSTALLIVYPDTIDFNQMDLDNGLGFYGTFGQVLPLDGNDGQNVDLSPDGIDYSTNHPTGYNVFRLAGVDQRVSYTMEV